MKSNNNNKLGASKGVLIVIEGIDSSGKETQVKMIFEQLLKKNFKVMKLEFPDYKSDSSALIKMYLNGEFGEDPLSVNPYAASLFFASDRFASYKTSWESFYNSSGIIIADRYVSSNMIYQAAKIKDDIERQKFMEWIYDLEFNKLNLPKPDIVIFLSMPVQFCLKLSSKRLNKITGLKDKDIHERNIKYLKKTYEIAIEAARKYQWNIVNCIKDDFVKPIEEINKEILEIIGKKLNGELKF